MLAVSGRGDSLGDRRAQTVGADDDLCRQGDLRSAAHASDDAGDPITGPHHITDREVLDEFDTGLDRSLDEQRIQHCPPRADVSATPPTAGPIPDNCTGPTSKRIDVIGAHPRARSRSSNPHASRRAAPRCHKKCVDMVSLGNVARSTSATRCPARASSIAVDAPAHRAPTTTTSCMVREHPSTSATFTIGITGTSTSTVSMTCRVGSLYSTIVRAIQDA